MKATATMGSAAVKTGVAMESRIAVKRLPATHAALRPTNYSITAESGLRPADIAVSMEALEALAAAEASRAMKIRAALEAMEARSAPNGRSTVEALPTAAAHSEIAPVIAVVEIPPSVMVVEIDPRRVVERYNSARERRPVEPVEPRTRANEHSAHKPFGPVVAIRRASVRRIGIVAIGANRRCSHIRRRNANVSRPHSYANRHANSGAGRPRREPCNSKDKSRYCGILQKISHRPTSLTGFVCSFHTPHVWHGPCQTAGMRASLYS